ncbi:MAG TPA: FkbM family methyltransferase [Limnobacter sp.]|uniref:FkbM family methyltransferase n=1 Tax=Limnobacter sp. TaxID=2003368 RepID=UPI002ED9815C
MPVMEHTLGEQLDALLHQPNNTQTSRWVSEFIDPRQPALRYAIGRNPEGLALSREVRLDGWIDDRFDGAEWAGLPVLTMKQVPTHAWVVNCSTSIVPVSVHKALKARGFERILSVADFIQHPTTAHSMLPAFVREQRLEWMKHQADWETLFAQLGDDESRNTLLNTLAFRLSADLSSMQGYTVRFREQYFEDFLNLNREVFVDCGGFDGDTTEEFCKRDPAYRRVYLFEPSPVNMAAAHLRLAHHRDIVFKPLGVSDAPGQLEFDPDAGSASAVGQGGQHSIRVNTVDAEVPEAATFIKMDLEGWELNALAGCRQQILKHKPKLAISVYHQASHFREVWAHVMSLNPYYKVRLRHYTEGWSETVMFFTEE